MQSLKDEIAIALESGMASQQLIALVGRAAILADESDLAEVRKLINEEYTAPLAMAALPGWGSAGIDILIASIFNDDLKLKTRARAFEVATCICRECHPTSEDVTWLSPEWNKYSRYPVSKDSAAYCLSSLRDQLLIAFADEYSRASFFFLFGTQAMNSFSMTGVGRSRFDFILSLVVDNQIFLNSSIISKFDNLLESKPGKEEDLHRFLASHPVLIDPFARDIISKLEFGNDLITDFVVRRANNSYVLVEIENSTDKLFLSNGSFSSNLTQAIAQVRDFQAWVSDNLSYAQKKMPGIKHPEGLVVIGRSSCMTDVEIKKLAEENHSRRGHIKIVTYDELLDTARTVHKNIVSKPVVRSSKDTRCI